MNMKTPNFEIPAEVRDMAEKSVEQAKKAFDGFVGAAHQAVSTAESQAAAAQASAKDMSAKAVSYVEKNIESAFSFASSVVKAKDVNELMALQNDFVKAQIATLTEQAKELGAVAQKTAADMQKSAADMVKGKK